jgi:hypothetical protein|nr:MAG TPA: hypothetical protein [Caudoviricetes sp.]DAX63307.1 MAG TPA: hypothetical protein [Caudoviricetes sp.]
MDKTERFLLQLQAVLDTIPDAVRKLDISCVDGVLAIRDGVDGSDAGIKVSYVGDRPNLGRVMLDVVSWAVIPGRQVKNAYALAGEIGVLLTYFLRITQVQMCSVTHTTILLDKRRAINIEDMTAFEVLNTLAVRLTEIDKR